MGVVNSSLITMALSVAISGLAGPESNYTPMQYNNLVESRLPYLVFMHKKQHELIRKNILILKHSSMLSEGIIRT